MRRTISSKNSFERNSPNTLIEPRSSRNISPNQKKNVLGPKSVLSEPHPVHPPVDLMSREAGAEEMMMILKSRNFDLDFKELFYRNRPMSLGMMLRV
jgi:hypothetical protein